MFNICNLLQFLPSAFLIEATGFFYTAFTSTTFSFNTFERLGNKYAILKMLNKATLSVP